MFYPLPAVIVLGSFQKTAVPIATQLVLELVWTPLPVRPLLLV